ncbi:MAG: cyclic nucleotide-binding domain-containing protein [Magnetococcales bacterium]|nr:cyclic nucleotide-binding domain-containing protein [Magnetococcales bacterium]
MKLVELIGRIPIFKIFSPQVQRSIASMKHTFIRYNENEFIVRQNTKEKSFFIMIRGTARVTLNEQPNKIIANLGAGAIFGEMAFLSGAPRSTNVIANEPDTVVMRVTDETFRTVPLEVRDQLKDRLIDILVARINSLNEQLIHKM